MLSGVGEGQQQLAPTRWEDALEDGLDSQPDNGIYQNRMSRFRPFPRSFPLSHTSLGGCSVAACRSIPCPYSRSAAALPGDRRRTEATPPESCRAWSGKPNGSLCRIRFSPSSRSAAVSCSSPDMIGLVLLQCWIYAHAGAALIIVPSEKHFRLCATLY